MSKISSINISFNGFLFLSSNFLSVVLLIITVLSKAFKKFALSEFPASTSPPPAYTIQ